MQPVQERIRNLYNMFGQRKEMGLAETDTRKPLFFLHRTFRGDQDLLIIFNTKRCQTQCEFCQLPAKSQKFNVPADDIVAQFEYVANELKHSLSVLTRITMSNEGSILDENTFAEKALLTIIGCIPELRLVKRLVVETRIEFINQNKLEKIKGASPKTLLDILVGFETLNSDIRDRILGKHDSIEGFRAGLDIVGALGCAFTAYVLYKPSPYMTDEEAFSEAESSIDFLATECSRRGIPLTIRLNPMYAATGSRWAEMARGYPDYKPPRLIDIIRLADKKAKEGVAIYIGLSTEGLDENWGTYLSREDFSNSLVKPIKLFNDGKADALRLVLMNGTNQS